MMTHPHKLNKVTIGVLLALAVWWSYWAATTGSDKQFATVIAALATYRLSRLIADEEGPWGMFSKLRDLTPEMSSWRRGIECIMCVSVWVAFPVAVLLGLFGAIDGWLTPLAWLALSAVTVIIRKWENKR